MTDRQTRRLVTAGTLALAAAAVGYVLRFGSNVPNTDEWDMLAPVLGERFPWAWLADHHNEHRYPLGRLVWAAVLRAGGFDFRAPMLLTVALLTAAALLLTDTARRVRGTASAGDLLIPALLLHWGHAFNLLMGYQLVAGLFAVGLAGVAWAAACGRPHLGGLAALVAVPTGGFGLAAAGPLALWLGWEGRRRPAVLVWPAVIVGYAAWVAATTPPRQPTGPAEQRQPLPLAAAEFLGVGLAPSLQPPAHYAAELVAVGLYGLAGWGVCRGPRPAVAGLAAAGLAVLSAGLAVGWGRGGGWADRFATASAAGLAVAWTATAGQGPRWGLTALGVGAAVVVVVVNTRAGLVYGHRFRGDVRAFQTDLRAGLPPLFLAGRYGGAEPFLVGETMADGVRRLAAAGAGEFRRVVADPPFAARPAAGPLPVRLACDNAPFTPGGPPPPAIPFGSSPGPAVGLRVRGEQLFPMGYQVLRLRWTDAAGVARSAEATPKVVPGPFTVAFPLGGPVADVRLEAGCPMLGLEVTSAEWLVPP